MKKLTASAIRLFVIVFSIAAVAFCFMARSLNYSYYEYEEAELSDISLLQAEGYEVEGSSYTKVSDHAHLLYRNKETKLYGMRFYFEEEPYTMQVYYSDDSEIFTEDKSVLVSYNGKTEVEVVFGEAASTVWIAVPEDFKLDKVGLLCAQKEIKQTFPVAAAPIAALVLAALLVCSSALRRSYVRLEAGLQKGIRKLWSNKLRYGKAAAVLVVMYALSVGIAKGIGMLLHETYFNTNRVWMIFVIMLFCWTIFVLRESLGKRPHVLFVVAALSLGMLTVFTTPRTPGVCWDDETHYGNVTELSYGGRGMISYTDNELISKYSDAVFYKSMYGAEESVAWDGKINAMHEQHPVLMQSDKYSHGVHDLAYIPAVLGIMLARGMGFAYSHVFIIGKLMNLLVYTLLFYLAIRMVKRGKLLLCAIGLLPTSLFLATQYSYDWWVHSFIALGYAMFISEMQKENHAITLKKWIAIMCVMTLGILPKAVYFPIIFPMLFIGRKRFESKRGWYWTINLFAMAVLVASFLLPMLLGGGGGNDMRGGTAVDSAGQIAFILKNPLSYTKILLEFLTKYVLMEENTLVYFGFMGSEIGANLVLVTLVVTAFLEGRRREPGVGKGFKRMLGLTLFGAVSLAATALYISFTPVGAQTILGCQVRYLFPLFFPLLYYFAECRINVEHLNRSKCAAVVMSIMSGMYMSALCKLCIEYRYFLE